MRLRIKVAATTANLGPGFDVLGLALSLYNTFELDTDTDTFSVSGYYDDDMRFRHKNLFWRCFQHGLQAFDLKAPPLGAHIHAAIPPQSGLGSSATAVVAGLVAAAAFAKVPIGDDLLLREAHAIEGHADNVAASLYGGFTLSQPGGDPPLIHLPPPRDLSTIVVYPHTRGRTAESRVALPRHFPRQDVVYNLGRTAVVALSLTGVLPYQHLRSAMDDRLHQPSRIPPGSLQDSILDAALEFGALGASLSGSGPSIFILTSKQQSATLTERLTAKFPDMSVWPFSIPAKGYTIDRL